MSMSDCVECWETPCVCGYGYRDWDDESIDDLIDTLNAVKKANKGGRKDTDDVFMDKVNKYKEKKQ